MRTYETSPSNPSTALSPALRAARLFAWGEMFILIPMHAFWMMFRSTPFVAENTASAWVGAVPIAVLILAGLAAGFGRFRAALLRAEWLFHLTGAAGMVVLLVYVTVRDPFSPALPITWPLCFWSICLGFAGLGNLALHERICAHAETKPAWADISGIALAFVAWAVFAWMASGITWAPYFWTVSLVFHVVMAWQSRRTAAVPRTSAPLRSATALFESVFVIALMLAAFLRYTLTCEQIGRLELKFVDFVTLAANPMFILGLAVALVAARFRVAFVVHAVLAAVFIFTDQAATWPIALVLGYGFTTLYVASTRQSSLTYPLALPAIGLMWMLGMLGFNVAGVIIEYNMGLGLLTFLIEKLRVVVPVLYGVFLALAGAGLFFSRRNAVSPETGPDVPMAGALGGVSVYAGVWLAILIPSVYFVSTAMWPPVFFEQPERVAVGKPSGVCHAGYSRSDEEYANLEALGVDLMRIDFHWARIQRDPDTWDFSSYDTYVEAAEKHGVDVLALLVFDNDNVETDEKGASKEHYLAPQDLPLYLEYIRRTVTHFKGRVYAWELWNEPDITRFWDGPIEELYDLIGKAATTVKEADPDAILLGPAATSPLGVDSPECIEHFHAIGALDQVEHPTMHTYVSEPRAYYNEILRVQNAAAKYDHPGSVWITELGDPDGGVYPWRGSREHLAVHAMKAYTISTRLGVEKLVWYCYSDSAPESLRKSPKNSEGFFGITNDDGSWKPAAYAFSLFSKNCSNSVIRNDLVDVQGGLAARQLRSVLYRREDGESALVLWFEPGLREGAHARVSIDLGMLEEPAVLHSITSDDTQPLLDEVIDVTETPTFITFAAPNGETPVTLRARTFPADAAWLLLAFGLVLGGIYLAVRSRPSHPE